MSVGWKPSLLPAYSTSRSAASISLCCFATLSPFEVQILRSVWYCFRIYSFQSLLGQREKQQSVLTNPGNIFFKILHFRGHMS